MRLHRVELFGTAGADPTILELALSPPAGRRLLDAAGTGKLQFRAGGAWVDMEAASTRENPETVMKLTVTACRVMKAFQEGVLVMHRLCHCDQRVVVQHVEVNDHARRFSTADLKDQKR